MVNKAEEFIVCKRVRVVTIRLNSIIEAALISIPPVDKRSFVDLR